MRPNYLVTASYILFDALHFLAWQWSNCSQQQYHLRQFQEIRVLKYKFIKNINLLGRTLYVLFMSRLINQKERQLCNAIITKHNNLGMISTGKWKYWNSERNKNPDSIDFVTIKNIDRSVITADTCTNLSTDY